MNTAAEEDSLRLLRRLTLFVGFIVFAIILTFCYFASEFCISIVLSAILAVLVDPLVERMAGARLKRSAAAGIVVVCGSLIFLALAFGLYRRVTAFANLLPRYSQQIEREVGPFLKPIHVLESGMQPARSSNRRLIQVKESPDWTSFLLRGAGSLRTLLVVFAVVPFLVFFMLVRKAQMKFRVVELLEGRLNGRTLIQELNSVLRGAAFCYLILGSAMAVVCCVVFALLGLNGALVLGIISGYANLIPYIGAIVAIALPVAGAMLQFSSITPIISIVLTVGALHFITANLIAPRWIGPRVNIGPAAVLAGMLFWGWLWGILGVILAIPLTACLKLVADQHPRLTCFSDLLADDLRLPERRPKMGSSSEKGRADEEHL